MPDVPGPGLAPDLYDDARRDVPQLYPDDGREVVHLVEVGIVVAGEALPGRVGHSSQVLLVRQSLPLAGGPHHPQLRAPSGFRRYNRRRKIFCFLVVKATLGIAGHGHCVS